MPKSPLRVGGPTETLYIRLLIASELEYGFIFAHFLSLVYSDNLRDKTVRFPPGGGGTPYNGLNGEAPPEKGTLFRLQV